MSHPFTQSPFVHLRRAIIALVLLSLLTGVVYPLVVTGVANMAFGDRARGTLLRRDGKVIGSKLLGQSFTTSGYFWGRPSATGAAPYDATASGGSNLGPTNPALLGTMRERIEDLRHRDPENTLPVPLELVTASGSGLDPHVSPGAAYYQSARIARVRGVGKERVEHLVEAHTEGRFLGLFGEPRVNVLELNLALDELCAVR